MELFIAGVAALIAALAWATSLSANRTANDAVTEAGKANVIAEEAKRIAKRSEDRETEISDVRWAIEFDGHRHVWMVRAVGNSPAINVTVEFSTSVLGGPTDISVVRRDRLEKGEVIELSVADEVQRKRTERLERLAAAGKSDVGITGDAVYGSAKVWWSSVNEVPGKTEVSGGRPFFAYWD